MLLALVVSSAFAQQAPPIVNGQTTSDYEAVGALIGCSSSCFSFCSGTLVNDVGVVTAAHCVDAMESYDRSGYTVWFGVGPQMGELEDYSEVESYHAHPQYNSYTLDNDIGVLVLKEDLSRTVEPYYVNTEAVSSSWQGKELQYVGYGVTSDNANDGGVKRTAAMAIHSYDGGFVYTRDTADGQNVCYGDSGGAALEKVADGIYELVGANSHVFGVQYNNYMCEGGGSGAARVDKYLDWIGGYFDVEGYDPNSGGGGGNNDGGGGGDEGGGNDGGGDGGGGDGGGDDGGGGNDGGGFDEATFDASYIAIAVPAGSSAKGRIFVDGAETYTLTVLQPPLHGEVVWGESDGWLTFYADEDFVGTDWFTVTVTSGSQELLVDYPVDIVNYSAMGCSSSGSSRALFGLGLLGLGLVLRRRD